MAAKSHIEDDSKVMDVAKPGQGKIIGTSRPIITPTKTAAQQSDVSQTSSDKEAEEALLPPSARQKVIQPTDTLVDEVKSEPENDAADTPEPSMSDAAGVDELAKSVVDKKKAAEQSKVEAERDQHVQELIESKKYIVPIGRAGTKSGAKKWIAVPIILILLLGGYLLVDAGVFGSDVKLPYEFIKDDASANDSSTERDSIQADPADGNAGEAATKKDETPASQIDPGSTTPEDQAGDDEAKNELKNLQVRLETYFNESDAYPMSLTDLSPMPTADELQDYRQQSYGYTTDGQTYVLSATLANGANYTLESVNSPN